MLLGRKQKYSFVAQLYHLHEFISERFCSYSSSTQSQTQDNKSESRILCFLIEGNATHHLLHIAKESVIAKTQSQYTHRTIHFTWTFYMSD